MNPESLLHEAAEVLRTEAAKGPGMMFLLLRAGTPTATRISPKIVVSEVVAHYDCEKFTKGLTSKQWSVLLLSLWNVHQEQQKGGASGP